MLDIDKFIRQMVDTNENKANDILKQKQQERINHLLSKSGIGERFKQRSFENFKINENNRVAFIKCKDFVDKFTTNIRGIILLGDVGRGKTHLAAAITNNLTNRLYTVMFGNITNLLSVIKSTYNKDSELSEKDILEIMARVDLLIIDDLGKENPTKNTVSLIYQIINRRYEENKTLVATTNYSMTNLKKTIGEATVSRLYEMCELIQLTGNDWRMSKWVS